MASTTLATYPQPLATVSYSRQNHLNHNHSISIGGAFDDLDLDDLDSVNTRANPEMSFSMSQGSQGSNLMMQTGGPFRQYEGNSTHNRTGSAPQIYSAIYSGVDVYEMEVNNVAVMRRRKDSWLNATQILKVAGIEKGKRTKVLEKEILIGEHEKVQGGYGKYQGTWIKFERGLEFCRQYGVEDVLRPLLTYDMGQDGGVAGRGGIDTPTKEQAMAAQRKRLYNASSDSRMGGQGTFFKNISSTASHAVAAISKARFDSPVPRMRNGSAAPRPASFSRQPSSQHLLGSQESPYPGGSQQSMQSFASAESFTVNGQDSAYATQSGPNYSHAGREGSRNGDLEEPPRKRMRPSPGLNDSQQPTKDDYYNMSMREPSPTEPNESFVYHPSQHASQDDENPAALMPLPSQSKHAAKKRALLMDLFTKSHETDYRDHDAFLALSPEDLDMPIDNSANTALHWAATLARLPLLKTLIARGASIFRVNRVGETALIRACVVTNNLDNSSFPDLLELLGPTIELLDSRGRTVLHHIAITSAVKGRSQASKYYLESLLEFVVRQGSAPNSQQSLNNVPPALKSIGIGRFMSEIVNVQDKSGDTALNIAARIGNRSIISQLLEVGADPALANRSNLCPIDFGIGDPLDVESRIGVFGEQERAMAKESRESSGEIITSISKVLSEVESDFVEEMKSKQSTIDSVHVALRDSSAALGKSRNRLEEIQESARQRRDLKLKLANLTQAVDDERSHLRQMQQQYGQLDGEDELQLGDADKGLEISPEAFPAHALLNITPNTYASQVHVQAQRQGLASLPSVHILRARLSAYKGNNDTLEEGLQGLKSKSSELAAKYRKIISLCTQVNEDRVDSHLDSLLRAVESESDDVELSRVREFLSRVDGGD